MTVPAERVERLTDLAHAAARAGRMDRARRYVRLAKRIAEHNRLDRPDRLRWFTCDSCDAYLLPGENARIRTQSGHVVLTCACGAQKRHGYDD